MILRPYLNLGSKVTTGEWVSILYCSLNLMFTRVLVVLATWCTVLDSLADQPGMLNPGP